MQRILIALLLLGSVIVGRPVLANDYKLDILTEDFPPLNYLENADVHGPAVDIVNAIQKKLGRHDFIKNVPWARGYYYLENKPGTVLFAIARSKEREGQFKWVGPIAKKKYSFFVKKGSTIKINNLEDAKKYKIGVQLGGVGMQHLQSEGFTKLDSTSLPKTNLVKLMGGRFDMWYSSHATAYAMADKLNIKRDEIKPVLRMKTNQMYIAFHKETKDSIITSWQQALESLMADGTIKNIYKAYGLESLYP